MRQQQPFSCEYIMTTGYIQSPPFLCATYLQVLLRNAYLWLQVAEQAGEAPDDVKKFSQYTYPAMKRTQVPFSSDRDAEGRQVGQDGGERLSLRH